jgi:hypothetical protein
MEIKLIDTLCVYKDEQDNRQMATIKSGFIWIDLGNDKEWKKIYIGNILALGVPNSERVDINI